MNNPDFDAGYKLAFDKLVPVLRKFVEYANYNASIKGNDVDEVYKMLEDYQEIITEAMLHKITTK